MRFAGVEAVSTPARPCPRATSRARHSRCPHATRTTRSPPAACLADDRRAPIGRRTISVRGVIPFKFDRGSALVLHVLQRYTMAAVPRRARNCGPARWIRPAALGHPRVRTADSAASARHCGCRPRSTTSTDCGSCSSRKASLPTERGSIEPRQPAPLFNFLPPARSTAEGFVSRAGIEPTATRCTPAVRSLLTSHQVARDLRFGGWSPKRRYSGPQSPTESGRSV